MADPQAFCQSSYADELLSLMSKFDIKQFKFKHYGQEGPLSDNWAMLLRTSEVPFKIAKRISFILEVNTLQLCLCALLKKILIEIIIENLF